MAKSLTVNTKNLTVNTAKNEMSDGCSTEDNSPSKMSYGEGQSPVRIMPQTFTRQKAKQFQGINLTSMNRDANDEENDDTKILM
jgi:hypothetical protein